MKTPLLVASLLAAIALSEPLSAQTAYEPYSFSTFASAAVPPNPAPVGSTDGARSAARFNSPAGTAVDANGTVYVADTGNHTIRKIAAGVVSTIAGSPGMSGSANGTGSAARFFDPTGVAVDRAFNLYVADSGNNTIRKITPGGVVSTLAGLAGAPGSANGTGSAARFTGPRSVAVDAMSNVYVADTFNDTVRKITPNGGVTTLAGLASVPGSANGTGSSARFNNPKGIAVDSSLNVYVCDTFNNTIRKITQPGAVVTTLAGSPGMIGSGDGAGANARFFNPIGLAVSRSGQLFVADADNQLNRKITAAGVVTTLGGTPTVAGSANGTGSVARFNSPQGVAVDALDRVYIADTGNNTIRLGQEPATAVLANISTRLSVQTGENVAIGGFIVTGSNNKKVVIRGIGPSLPNNIAGRLPDPTLELHNSANAIIARNDNWKVNSQTGQSQQAEVEATMVPPPNDLESALVITLAPGNYTAVLAGKNSTRGVALVEVYDLDAAANSTLANISTRGVVQTGANVMIGGFILNGGNGFGQVIIRAIGPSLPVAGKLANPTLELHDVNGVLLALNDNWKTNGQTGQSQEAEVRATTVPPANDLESAIVATIPAGQYTAIVAGKNGGTGVGLVEVFNLR